MNVHLSGGGNGFTSLKYDQRIEFLEEDKSERSYNIHGKYCAYSSSMGRGTMDAALGKWTIYRMALWQ